VKVVGFEALRQFVSLH